MKTTRKWLTPTNVRYAEDGKDEKNKLKSVNLTFSINFLFWKLPKLQHNRKLLSPLTQEGTLDYLLSLVHL